MAIKVRLVIFIASLILIGGFGWQTSLAQPGDGQYFPETGHWITGEFLSAYLKASNPLLLYGYPITDAFIQEDSSEKFIVQYFQKARFELHPGAPVGQRVQFSPLGAYLYKPGPSLPTPDASAACRTFSEIDYQICYAFLDFFEANGGLTQFGYPISNFELQDERIVQYFERARFEWHPERPSGQRVVLANLGSQYFYIRGENPVRLLTNSGSPIAEGIVNLRVRAFPQSSVTGSQGLQTVYVTVQDQKYLPVPNAQVTLVVHLPSGEENHYIVPTPTNQRGVTQYSFPFDSDTNGSAQIQVTVTYENIEKTTSTSFRIWW